MAKENPLDDFPLTDPLTGAETASGEESDLDQQIDGLRGVLKKDAGELPIVENENEGGAGMADFGSDFGAGAAMQGPAIIEQLDATTILWPGQKLEVDRFGQLLLGPMESV